MKARRVRALNQALPERELLDRVRGLGLVASANDRNLCVAVLGVRSRMRATGAGNKW